MINFHYTQVRTQNKLGNFFFLDSSLSKFTFSKGHWEGWQNDEVTYFRFSSLFV